MKKSEDERKEEWKAGRRATIQSDRQDNNMRHHKAWNRETKVKWACKQGNWKREAAVGKRVKPTVPVGNLRMPDAGLPFSTFLDPEWTLEYQEEYFVRGILRACWVSA